MFGLLRTVLAFLVVAQHLHFRHTQLGVYAVFGFFIISGYLMTLIMHTSYGYSLSGRGAFVLNRVLRLYPQYWVTLLIALMVIVMAGESVTLGSHVQMAVPGSISSWFQNVAMYFPAWRPDLVTPKPIPAIWALTTELTFYTAICFGASRTPQRVTAWFSLSVLYLAWSFSSGQEWQDRYMSIGAGSLPFSIGAGIYFISKNVDWSSSARTLFLLMLGNSAGWALVRTMHGEAFADVGFYLNLAICAALVLSLANGGIIFRKLRSFDGRIGDYSYPVYLLHWPVAVVVYWLVFDAVITNNTWQSFVNMIFSCYVVFCVSALFVRLIDRPIQRLRSKIRSRHHPR